MTELDLEPIPASLIHSIAARLVESRPVREALPGGATLNVDRLLPFLCVYRRDPRRQDAGTGLFVAAEAAYLNAPGTATRRKGLKHRHVAVAPETPTPTTDAIIGQSGGMQEVYKLIGRVAPTDATILIRGESGTGKELVTRAIYQHSNRAHAPLLVLNCTAVPDSLLESELFGHERGAFTGAVARRIGKFEQAAGGTLFLDEIGDIALSTQAIILRVLEEKQFQRVGGNETVRTDVRLLAATNRDLEKAMAEGQFREDLYHRLNVVTIRLPPLRERPEDVPRLIDYFLQRFSAELKTDKPPISDDALGRLRRHPWPGNVRELEHCIHRTLILKRGHPIQAVDLSLDAPGARRGDSVTQTTERRIADLAREYLDFYRGGRGHADFLEAADRLLIEEALRRTNGNQSQAARLLGLTRPTLHAKLHKFGLHVDR